MLIKWKDKQEVRNLSSFHYDEKPIIEEKERRHEKSNVLYYCMGAADLGELW